MTLIEAIQNGHYSLAAHVIVLVAARAVRNGGSSHVRKKAPQLLRQRSR